MSINQKLLQYAEYKEISQRKFTTSIGLAEGVLRKGQNIGSQHLKKIKDKYHDINMNWLLFSEGEMVHETENLTNESDLNYKLPCKKCENLEMEMAHMKELIAAKNEIIEILKHNSGIPQ